MSIIIKKGSSYNAEYASIDYPVLSYDWTGSVSFYVAYPGVATFTKALTRVGDKMTLEITIAEILALESGLYSFVSTIENAVLGISVSNLEYAVVTDATVFDVPMTKLFITLSKSDATPAGKQVRSLFNTVDGVSAVLGWEGPRITVSNPVADEFTGTIIGTESISVTSNQTGYAEIYVIKGLTVAVSCPVFGKAIEVDTTGLDEVDLSTYFIPAP